MTNTYLDLISGNISEVDTRSADEIKEHIKSHLNALLEGDRNEHSV